jgi:uncharacterized membrane protein
MATDVSADGSTIVGYSSSAVKWWGDVFRWTEETGMVRIEGPDEDPDEIRIGGVSGDGEVIVGGYWKIPETRGYRLVENEPMTLLGILDHGGTKLYSEALGVSADGSVIVGESRNDAFRWTGNSEMVSLEVPGDNRSAA